MTGRAAPGSLERTLAALVVNPAQAQRRKNAILADGHTGEYLQQLRVPLTGLATPEWAFVDADYTWELPFLYAPAQRRMAFQTPHFNPGIEMVQAGDLVIVHAHVAGWNISEEGWYIGATVRFASQAPLASTRVPFSAIAHLTFQGYATSAEGDEYTQ